MVRSLQSSIPTTGACGQRRKVSHIPALLSLMNRSRLTCHEQGKEGLVVAKTKQAVLIAHHPETVQTNACVNTVEALADYLIGVGY